MPQNVDILFVSPAGSDEHPAIQDPLRSISAQSHPASLRNLVHVHYVEEEPGARTSALNAAHENAQGDYVIHAHAGVMWDGHKLAQQVQYLEDHPAQAACAHPMTARNTAGRTRHYNLSNARAYGAKIANLMGPAWGAGALMVRKEAYGSLGVFRNIEEAQWEYDLRLVTRGHKVGLMDEDLAVWNRDSDELGDPVGGLTATEPRHSFLAAALSRARARDLLGGRTDETAAQLLVAGLHLRNDSVDAAQEICLAARSESDHPEAAYWLGMAHRRQSDYDSARACFNETGERMTAAPKLHERVSGFLQQALQMPDYGQSRQTALEWFHRLREGGSWDAPEFVDLCEACTCGGRPDDRRLLEEVQAIEWETLFEATCTWARGG